MPKVIALGAAKGGVGKSTMASWLAVYGAEHRKRTALVDYDPQQSATMFYNTREADDVDMLELQATLATLIAGTGDDYDVIIIDCGPGDMARLGEAVAVADLALIPSKPSALCVNTTGVVVDMAIDAGTPYMTALNMTKPRSTANARALAELASVGRVHPIQIIDRQDYQTAYEHGLAPWEFAPNSKAASEALAFCRHVYAMREVS